MSQSALTQALNKLETIAGAHLFERAGFGVTATDAGHVLIGRARRAIALLQAAERDIRAQKRSALRFAPLHRHITASQLRALIAIADTRGYSAAARKLGLAQPTVHRAAKDLEAIVGVTLFARAARGIESTETARELARIAELVFVEVRQGLESVRELRGLTTGRIAIGALPLVRSEFLPVAVDRLLQRFPDAKVQIQDGPYPELLHALRYGHIDWLVGALRDPTPSGDVLQERLFDQPLAIVVRPGHPLLAGGNPTPDALAELEWIAPRPRAPARLVFDAYFDTHGVATPTRTIECGSLVTTRHLLRASDRAAMLSPLQIRDDIADGTLSVLLESIPNSHREIGITTRADFEPTQVQSAFASIVRELARQSVA